MVEANPIDALGGAAVVGIALRARGVPVANVTVRSWSLAGRSIPAKYWTHLAAIGEEKGSPISFEALAERAAAAVALCTACDAKADGELAACTAVNCPNRQREAA